MAAQGAGLLAGATGTVGREVVAGLAAAGAEVQAVTRSPGSARLAAGVQAVRGDLMNPDSLTGLAGLSRDHPRQRRIPRRPDRSGPGNNQRRHVPSLDCLTRLHGISVLEINKDEACRTRTSSRRGSHDKEQLVRSTDHEQIGEAEQRECRG